MNFKDAVEQGKKVDDMLTEFSQRNEAENAIRDMFTSRQYGAS